MDQHPIPQNVTQYQFKLIGFMTLKQFGMLGAFLLLAFLTTKLPLIPSIFKWPIAITFASLGFAIAFVPYEERTLDIWLINFFKSIYNPTQYLWNKQPRIPDYFNFSSIKKIPPPPLPTKSRTPLARFNESLSVSSTTPWDKKELDAIEKFNRLFSPNPISQAPHTSAHPTPSISKNPQPAGFFPRVIKSPPSRKQIQNILFQNQIKLTQNQASAKGFETTMASNAQSKISQTIEKNLSSPQSSSFPPPSPPPSSPPNTSPSLSPAKPLIQKAPNLSPPMDIKSLYPDNGPKKKSVTPQFLSDTNMPISPNAPNIIVGMTLSIDEKLISNAIVEISDKNNIPVRAVKSNKLGQFFIATPVKNGAYTINTEHPEYKFDTIKIEAKGEIIPPLKIVATT